MARSMGIRTEVEELPSIALGTPYVRLLEMVGAYGTFANGGVFVKPVLITKIEDKDGKVVYEYEPETKDVISPDVAFAMVNPMEGVTRFGSGQRLRHSGATSSVYKEIITGYPYQLKIQ